MGASSSKSASIDSRNGVGVISRGEGVAPMALSVHPPAATVAPGDVVALQMNFRLSGGSSPSQRQRLNAKLKKHLASVAFSRDLRERLLWGVGDPDSRVASETRVPEVYLGLKLLPGKDRIVRERGFADGSGCSVSVRFGVNAAPDYDAHDGSHTLADLCLNVAGHVAFSVSAGGAVQETPLEHELYAAEVDADVDGLSLTLVGSSSKQKQKQKQKKKKNEKAVAPTRLRPSPSAIAAKERVGKRMQGRP